MKSFMDRVSADLYDKYGSDISKLCLVFPSRRARLFFAESLSKRIAQPLWQPEALSISDLIFRWAGKRPSDSLRLIAELYKVYRNVQTTVSDVQIDSFESFYRWGEMLLHDFDQIDKYLVPAKALYQNLYDQKMLEGDYSFLTSEQVEAVQMFWGSFNPQKSALQESFTQMWAMMFPLYTQFKRSLLAHDLAYEGMLYQQVADNIHSLTSTPQNLSVTSYVFIGFNALNKCEHTIFCHLQASSLAIFYWDRDDYYINDSCQEAGWFLRKNLRDFPPADSLAHYNDFSTPKEITSWSLPSDVLQTKLTPQIIQENALHTDKRTAVVLCDESLLIPLLGALPDVTPNINVTMGYPLVRTSLYTFIEALLMFYQSARHRDTSNTYYHADVLRLLNHPFIHYLCPDAATQLKKKIIDDKILFVRGDFFASALWMQQIAQYPNDPEHFLQMLLNLLDAIEAGENHVDPLLPPILRYAAIEIHKFKNSLQTCGLQISIPLSFTLLRRMLRSLSVPFSGEPLQGIQVMGILETRTLDFEHVVLLSAQEGLLPAASESPSFIPHNLKVGFGLPVQQEREAIYAYYFYRLLQRAQKVFLLHGHGGDGLSSGEPSRYLLQLEAESPHTLIQKRLSMPVTLPTPAPPIEIEKRGVCKERLLCFLDPKSLHPLTPSALNTYLQCPLQFYFRYIKQIKEADEVEEDSSGRSMGTLLHRVMELLYKPFLESEVTSADLERLLNAPNQIRHAVELAIQKEYASSDYSIPLLEQGRWLILSDVLVAYVTQVIKFDKAETPFTLKAVEEEVKEMFHISERLSAPLRGFIDAIQERAGTYYVIDYKTGSVQNSFESMESLFSFERRSQNSAVFQVLWYVMLYQERLPTKKVLPLLYYIRSFFDPDASAKLFDKSTKSEVDDIEPYIEAYRALLRQKLGDLFDLSQPFVQTQDTEHCAYCSFNAICQRES